MTKRLFIPVLALAAAAALFFCPRGAEALNPNHQCSYCHSTHTPPGSTLLDNAVVEALCLTCHGPAGVATQKADVHKDSGGTTNATCIDCHNSHDNMENWKGTTNIKNIGRDVLGDGIARIATPNSGTWDVVFTSRGTGVSSPSLHSFADNNEDGLITSAPLSRAYDGICEVCHTSTTHHLNTGDPFDPGHQNIGKTCTTCHVHDSSFLPSGGGSCTVCHNSSQAARRPIVPEFSYASHHATSGTITDADCEVCHDQSNHWSGNVRLFDVDGGPSIVLSGDPSTSQTQADKLTSFCLACHDSDGAGGSAPFLDEVMPPVIDATTFLAGSHNNGSISCFGDGSSFGCHGSGHGSQKKKILAPFATGPGTNNAGEEEGLCFNCHDFDGPASADIQTLFGLANHHPIVNDDANRPGNDRDPECTMCHNQHYVASTPAHTVSNIASGKIDAVPGYNASGSTVSLVTYEYELCFLCHADFTGSVNDPGYGGADPVADKRAQFDTTNATFHPVRGAQNNPYTAPTTTNSLNVTMVAPWNQTTDQHDTMWCADCHNSGSNDGPHGSTSPTLLRASLSAINDGDSRDPYYTPLCIKCHDRAVYVDGTASGSRFSAHNNSNHPKPDWSLGYGGCLSCHFGGMDPASGIHGGANDSNGNGGTITPGWMNGSRQVNWSPGSCTVVSASAGAGDSGCKGHTKSY